MMTLINPWIGSYLSTLNGLEKLHDGFDALLGSITRRSIAMGFEHIAPNRHLAIPMRINIAAFDDPVDARRRKHPVVLERQAGQVGWHMFQREAHRAVPGSCRAMARGTALGIKGGTAGSLESCCTLRRRLRSGSQR